MADQRWQGGAMAVAQVTRISVDTYDAATTYSLTVNHKSVTALAQATVNATASSLAASWAAAGFPEFGDASASVSSNTITFTGNTAGVPFTVTPAVSGGAGTIGSATATTAATGPNFWDNADNWSGGSVPTTGDTAWIENSETSIKYGLAQQAVTLAALNVAMSFTGEIGLSEINKDGTAYYEYRTRYLKIGATAVNLGDGPGNGFGRLNLDSSTITTTLTMRGAGTPTDGPETETVQWKGTSASNVLNLYKGSLAVAGYGGDVSTVATMRVGYISNPGSDVSARLGSGTTLTTLNMDGGIVDSAVGCTTITKTNGTLTVRNGNITTLTNTSGAVSYKGSGTITTAKIGGGATLTFSEDMRARTITTCQVFAGATVTDPFATVTFSNGIALQTGARLTNCTIDVGQGRTVTPS